MVVLYIVLALSALAVLALLITSFVLFRFAFARKGFSLPIFKGNLGDGLGEYAQVVNEGIAWNKAQKMENITITSFDSLKLHAYYLPCENARGTVICVHGYRGSGLKDFSMAIKPFHEMGMNVLIPDQRAHGLSEGEYITMGVKERFDCISWANYISENDKSENKIYLDGISMGASSVLMASELMLPEKVSAIIADCGFTEPWEILYCIAKKTFKLQPRLLLPFVELWCVILGHFSLKGADTRTALKKCRVPVLFAHGTADNFVPYTMSEENYRCCASDKYIILAEGAVHGMSYLVETDKYNKKISEFFSGVFTK